MALFALIHGAWHGAWCWDKLVPELEARGHRTVTMDLPCDVAGATMDDFVGAVVSAVDPVRGDDELVLVGHSMGGITMAEAAEKLTPARVVYLAAFVPKPEMSVGQEFMEGPPIVADFGTGQIDHGDGSTSWQPTAGISTFFHDCTRADAEWAASMLRREYFVPIGWQPTVTDTRKFPATYIVCREDKTILPDWSRKVAPERLGVEAIELDGGHSPFIARPAELAELLV